MGWVSILDPEMVKRLLEIPPAIVLVAYLCLGYPIQFEESPMLEQAGWESRTPLDQVVFAESWNQQVERPLHPNRSSQALSNALPFFSPRRPRPIEVGIVA